MKQEFIAGVKSLQAIDIKSNPNYRVLIALATTDNAIYPKRAEVAASIKLNVNQTFVDDMELFAAVETYVEILNKIWAALLDDLGYMAAEIVFLKYAEGMTLTYTA